jgi:hypothetical protein
MERGAAGFSAFDKAIAHYFASSGYLIFAGLSRNRNDVQ